MTLAKWTPTTWQGLRAGSLSLGLLVAIALAPVWSQAGFLSSASRSYGPTAPNGYVVRIDPQMATLAHSQHQDIEVTVQNAQGKPVEGVEVHFQPSEGTVTTKPGSGKTRDGVVQGTFAAGMGGDQPRTAHVLVRVENVEVTVFIDIVPAVFGR